MSTRSTYLARTLLTRTQSLSGSVVEEGLTATQVRGQMRELVAKVLAVEEGITDESKVRLVLDVLPTVRPGTMSSDRELRELADSLEAQLWR